MVLSIAMLAILLLDSEVVMYTHTTVDYVIPNTNIGVHSPENVLYQLRGVDY